MYPTNSLMSRRKKKVVKDGGPLTQPADACMKNTREAPPAGEEEMESHQEKPKKRISFKGRSCGKWLWPLAGLIAVLGALMQSQVKMDISPLDDIWSQVASLEAWNITMQDTFTMSLAEVAGMLPAFSLPNISLPKLPDSAPQAGLKLSKMGVKKKHPLILVPGFVTSGLELWEGQPCAKKYFRQRMWGTMTMARTFMLDRDCWIKHMGLDPFTGLDPEGIRLRAATGLEAVDYFMEGYWVFGRLVEAMAHVGYDSTDLISMPYDWRLALPNLELRDGYFTRLKNQVETSHLVSGEKPVVLSHSYGGQVMFNFLQWVAARDPLWPETHVEGWINVAGTLLGATKSLSCLLSGEMRETAYLSTLAAYFTDTVMPRQARTKVWRSWGASMAMLPVGGPEVWGNSTWAPDDDEKIKSSGRTRGVMLAAIPVKNASSALANHTSQPLSNGSHTSEVGPLDEDHGEEEEEKNWLEKTVRGWFGRGSSGELVPDPNGAEYLDVLASLRELVKASPPMFEEHLKKWSAVHLYEQEEYPVDKGSGHQQRLDVKVFSPLKKALPHAPSMKIYCLYGVGAPTERGYHFLKSEPETPGQEPEWKLNTKASDPDTGLDMGIQVGDGDGTVPLISLGYVCRRAWRSPKLNPGNSSVTVREYKNTPSGRALDVRGGPLATTHVEVLGYEQLMADVIKIATGYGHKLRNQIKSDLDVISARIPLDLPLWEGFSEDGGEDVDLDDSLAQVEDVSNLKPDGQDSGSSLKDAATLGVGGDGHGQDTPKARGGDDVTGFTEEEDLFTEGVEDEAGPPDQSVDRNEMGVAGEVDGQCAIGTDDLCCLDPSVDPLKRKPCQQQLEETTRLDKMLKGGGDWKVGPEEVGEFMKKVGAVEELQRGAASGIRSVVGQVREIVDQCESESP